MSSKSKGGKKSSKNTSNKTQPKITDFINKQPTTSLSDFVGSSSETNQMEDEDIGQSFTSMLGSFSDSKTDNHGSLFETNISNSLNRMNTSHEMDVNDNDLGDILNTLLPASSDVHLFIEKRLEEHKDDMPQNIDQLETLDIGKFINGTLNDQNTNGSSSSDSNQVQTAMQICNIFRDPETQNSSELLKKATSSLLQQQNQNDSEDDDDTRSVASSVTDIRASQNADFNEIYGPGDEGGDYEYLDDILKGMLKRKKRREKGTKVKKTRKKKEDSIPKEVKEMIGEANLQYIYREFTKAVQILLEVIRVCPNIAEPYHTLGLIYEELGNMDKAIEFYLIAGLLMPTDPDFWRRLTELSIAHNKLTLAAYCLKRTILIDPKNYNARIKQCELYMKMNQPHRAISGYKSLLKQFPGDLPVVVSLAKIYYELKQVFNAINLLENTISADEQNADYTVINMLSELYMNEGWFNKAVQLIEKISLKQNIPIDLFPFDITSKYAMSQTYLGKLDKVEHLFKEILGSSSEVYGDLFFNIAEMYYVVNEYRRALEVYQLLTQSENYNKPSIWLRIAESYKSLKEYEESIRYGEIVLESLPDNVEARILLSEVYKEMGDTEKAIQVLESSGNEMFKKDLSSLRSNFNIFDNEAEKEPEENQESGDEESEGEESDEEQGKDPDFNPELEQSDEDDFNLPDDIEEDKSQPGEQNRTEKVKDIRIMVKKAWILHSTGQHEEFIKTALPVVLSILDLDQENPEWLTLGKRKKRIILNYDIGLKRQRKKIVDQAKEDGWTWTEALNAMGDYNLYTFIVTLCKTLAYSQRNEECLEILSVLLLNSRSTRKKLTFKTSEEKQRKKQHLRYLFVAVSYNSGFYKRAYNALRPIISEKPYSIPLLNLFNKITTRVGNILANHGFLLRLLDKHPQSVPLMLLVGHNCAMSGSHKLAIGEYFRAYRFMPNEPIISLCLGLSYLNLVMNRRTANRHLHVMQAFTFFYRYFELREGSQEAHFNLARAYHQLRLYHLATPYYKKVLEISDSNQINPDEDLKCEAAYNLSLIYRESGNLTLVEYLVDKYLSV